MLREEIQKGYFREYDLEEKLAISERQLITSKQKVICLIAANALLEIKLRRLH
jgi:hypothetical protein